MTKVSAPWVRVRRGVVAGMVLVAGLASACTDGDEPGGDPSPTVTSDSPSPTETSGSPGPSVSPATGLMLELPKARVRVPRGYKELQPEEFLVSASDTETTNFISLSDTAALGQSTIQELARSTLEISPYLRKPRILAPTTLQGERVYHVAGRIDAVQYLEEFGTIYDGDIVVLTFVLESRIPPQERQELIDSVFASFEWK